MPALETSRERPRGGCQEICTGEGMAIEHCATEIIHSFVTVFINQIKILTKNKVKECVFSVTGVQCWYCGCS